MRERVSNNPAPGFPDRRAMPSDSMARKAAAPSEDPVASLLGGYTAPAKSSKGAMYAPPAAVRILGGDGSTSNQNNGTARGVANVSDILARFKEGGPALSSSPHASTSTAVRAGQASGPTRRPAPVTTEPSVSPKRPRLSASDILAAAPRATGPTSSDNPLQASFEAPALARPGSNGRSSLVNRHPLDPVRDHVSATPYVHTSFAPIVWPRGSFQVYLIVDSREGTREAGKRVELCEKMEREGVRVDGKMMPLGDMIWVARRVDPVTKRPTGADDVVLDAIVERKRLDDLCNSIIDGRYVGQKVRLALLATREHVPDHADSVHHLTVPPERFWHHPSDLPHREVRCRHAMSVTPSPIGVQSSGKELLIPNSAPSIHRREVWQADLDVQVAVASQRRLLRARVGQHCRHYQLPPQAYPSHVRDLRGAPTSTRNGHFTSS